MSDYFVNLAARVLGLARVLEPQHIHGFASPALAPEHPMPEFARSDRPPEPAWDRRPAAPAGEALLPPPSVAVQEADPPLPPGADQSPSTGTRTQPRQAFPNAASPNAGDPNAGGQDARWGSNPARLSPTLLRRMDSRLRASAESRAPVRRDAARAPTAITPSHDGTGDAGSDDAHPTEARAGLTSADRSVPTQPPRPAGAASPVPSGLQEGHAPRTCQPGASDGTPSNHTPSNQTGSPAVVPGGDAAAVPAPPQPPPQPDRTLAGDAPIQRLMAPLPGGGLETTPDIRPNIPAAPTESPRVSDHPPASSPAMVAPNGERDPASPSPDAWVDQNGAAPTRRFTSGPQPSDTAATASASAARGAPSTSSMTTGRPSMARTIAKDGPAAQSGSPASDRPVSELADSHGATKAPMAADMNEPGSGSSHAVPQPSSAQPLSVEPLSVEPMSKSRPGVTRTVIGAEPSSPDAPPVPAPPIRERRTDRAQRPEGHGMASLPTSPPTAGSGTDEMARRPAGAPDPSPFAPSPPPTREHPTAAPLPSMDRESSAALPTEGRHSRRDAGDRSNRPVRQAPEASGAQGRITQSRSSPPHPANPRIGAAADPTPTPAAAPQVHVTIGRLEVHVVRALAAPPPAASPGPRAPALTLGNYLKRRGS